LIPLGVFPIIQSDDKGKISNYGNFEDVMIE
jgi:hypothetical protein